MPVYNDAKAAAAKKLCDDVRAMIDTAYDAVLAEAGLTREEKANLMVEIHNNYTRNDTLHTEVARCYKVKAEEPVP